MARFLDYISVTDKKVSRIIIHTKSETGILGFNDFFRCNIALS